MALTKELKIGLLAVISLVILFVGFYFLKGANVFSSDQSFYCYYKNVEGLQNSAFVQMKGMNVGHVSGMQLIPGKGVKVTITVNKSLQLPDSTIASLESPDLLSPKTIVLLPGPGPGMLSPGGELIAAREGGVVDNVTAELTPRLKEMKSTITSIDTTLADVNVIVNAQNQREIAEALHSIKITANNMAEISEALKKETSEINAIVHNANSITSNLAKNNDTINSILTNANKVSRQMSNAPIQKTLEDMQTTISEFKEIADKINTSKGSLGLLINDKQVYNNLNSSLRSLDSLEKDIKAHPKRYIDISVFGKSK